MRTFLVKAEVIDAHEQRRLAEFPNIQKIKFKDVPLSVGNYINDHFGFRDQLIELRGAINHFFHNSGDPVVLWGKDGWLFYMGDGTDRDLLHNSTLTEQQYSFLGNAINQRVSAFDSTHILYLFVVAPNKSTVYPEFLPNGLVDEGNSSLLQDIQRSMQSYPLAKEHFLSMAPELKAAKGGKYELYYKTDTHWNLRGAYIGYRAIIDRLNELAASRPSQGNPAVAPFPVFNILESDFTTNGKARYGDMDGMIGVNLPDREVSPSLATFSANQTYCKAFVSRWWQNYFDQGTGWRNPYCVYNKNARSNKTLLVFADSFTQNLCPYYSETFQRVICAYVEPTNNLMSEMVDRYHPDVVIEERVERYMGDEFQLPFLDAQTHPLDLSNAKVENINAVDLGSLTNGSWLLVTEGLPDAMLRQIGTNRSVMVSGKVNTGLIDTITQPFEGADKVVVSGWAVSSLTRRPFDAVIMTVGSDIAALDLPSIERPDVLSKLANPNASKCGFLFTVPFQVLHMGPVRFFGILGGKDVTSYHLEEIKPANNVLPQPINVPGLFKIVNQVDGIQVQAPDSNPTAR